jgi:hypothetical protein
MATAYRSCFPPAGMLFPNPLMSCTSKPVQAKCWAYQPTNNASGNCFLTFTPHADTHWPCRRLCQLCLVPPPRLLRLHLIAWTHTRWGWGNQNILTSQATTLLLDCCYAFSLPSPSVASSTRRRL